MNQYITIMNQHITIMTPNPTVQDSELDNYIETGDLKNVRWYYDHYPHKFTQKSLDLALYHGHLDIILFLDDKQKWDITAGIDWAAINNHMHVIHHFHQLGTLVLTKNALNLAAMNGYFEMVKWIVKHFYSICNLNTAHYYARDSGHWAIATYLMDIIQKQPS